jgi:hypothetical protein
MIFKRASAIDMPPVYLTGGISIADAHNKFTVEKGIIN